MKTILCYGDSNTWGYAPSTAGRYAYDVRWPGVLRAELGEGYHVIEEGLNGRTTVWDDPIEEHKNGKTYLMPCLETHKPLDLVVLMLGTNDLKLRFSVSAYDIAAGAGRLVDIIQRSTTGHDEGAPQVLLVAPPPVGPFEGDFAEMFTGAEAKAAKLSAYFETQAALYGCAFLDAAAFVNVSPLDGIHLELSEQRKLGERVAERVRELLADS